MNHPRYKKDGYVNVHWRRYELSIAKLKGVCPPPANILELGGGGVFSDLLSDEGYTVTQSQGDLRYATHKGTYDAVLCMEVLEHIHDREKDTPTQWEGTGTAHMLREAWLSLKPGGHLLLSTPNADSINAIHKVIYRQAGFVYRPHVREYTVHEVVTMARDAGFNVLHVDTHEVWDNCMNASDRAKITSLIERTLGKPGLDKRGEDMFLLARKD